MPCDPQIFPWVYSSDEPRDAEQTKVSNFPVYLCGMWIVDDDGWYRTNERILIEYNLPGIDLFCQDMLLLI